MAIRAVGFDFLGVIAKPSAISGLVADVEVLSLADKLRQSGFKVGLLSNLSPSGASWLYDAGIDRHFDAVVLTSETGLAKPDPEAFRELAKRLGAATRELIFIDDHATSMAGAQDLGITPVVYKNTPELLDSLTRAGVRLT